MASRKRRVNKPFQKGHSKRAARFPAEPAGLLGSATDHAYIMTGPFVQKNDVPRDFIWVFGESRATQLPDNALAEGSAA